MAGTRRSTRQSTTTAPKYTDASSPSADEKAPTRNGTKAASRKRAREEDDNDDEDEDVNDDTPPPPKKSTKGKAKAKVPSKAAKPAPSKASKPAPEQDGSSSSKPTRAGPPPAPSSPSNRDASGEQEVFWLLKAEPLPRYENGINVAFSIDDLAACTAPEPWSGVRNPQARNNMQAMRVGDLGFFYHSNAKPSGVAGILRVVGEAVVDETAFDSKDAYFDAKSKREAPKWYCVSVEFVKKFEKVVDLATIKGEAGVGGKLEGMQVVTNSRLSVSRVRKAEWEYILGLAGEGDGKEEEKESVEKEE